MSDRTVADRERLAALLNGDMATGDTIPADDSATGDTVATPTPERKKYKPHPTHLYPLEARDLIREVSRSMGCDESYVALPALVAMAGIIGNRRHAVVKTGWTEPTIIWAMVIGKSGTAKTPAAKPAMKPLRDYHARLMRENETLLKAHRAELLRYEAQLTAWKKKPDGDPPAAPDAPDLPRLIISDTTSEAMVPILRSNPGGIVLIQDEIAGWIGGFDRYAQNGGGDLARWLSIHSGEDITVDRKSGGTTFVPITAVSVFGGIQPDRLPKVFTPALCDSGLFARILMASPPPQPKPFDKTGVDEKVTNAWAELLAVMAEKLSMATGENGEAKPNYIGMKNNARKHFGWWADQLNAGSMALPGDVASARSKIEAAAVRIALIFATAEFKNQIELDHVRRACELADWFAYEAERVYAALGEAEDQREADTLWRWIRSRGSRAAVRDVMRSGPRAYRGKGEPARIAMDNLVHAGRARWTSSTPGDGRGRQVLELIESTSGDTIPTGDIATGDTVASRHVASAETDAGPADDDHHGDDPDHEPADDTDFNDALPFTADPDADATNAGTAWCDP